MQVNLRNDEMVKNMLQVETLKFRKAEKRTSSARYILGSTLALSKRCAAFYDHVVSARSANILETM